jgi:hypothetical protein
MPLMKRYAESRETKGCGWLVWMSMAVGMPIVSRVASTYKKSSARMVLANPRTAFFSPSLRKAAPLEARTSSMAFRALRNRGSHWPFVKPELSSGNVPRKSVVLRGSELV